MRLLILLLTTMSFVPSTAIADLFYGVDQTNLILIDPLTPSNSTVIGAHNLPSHFVQANLAYDPGSDSLVGITSESGSPYTRRLVQYDRTTGNATILANLGGIDDVGLYEGTEYVDSLGSLVSGKSEIGSAIATKLYSIDLAGTTSPLLTTSPPIDNDHMAYDSLRDRLFSVDSAGGTTDFYQVDLGSGNVTVQGTLPSSLVDDLAYSFETDSFYLLFGNVLYQSDASAISFNSIGTVPGTKVRGLAVVSSVPEPVSALAGGFFLLSLTLLRRRRINEQANVICLSPRQLRRTAARSDPLLDDDVPQPTRNRRWHHKMVSFVLVFVITLGFQSFRNSHAQSQWLNINGGDYNSSSNWANGVPGSVAHFTPTSLFSSINGPVYFSQNTALGTFQTSYAVDFNLRGFQIDVVDQAPGGFFGAPVTFFSTGPQRGSIDFDGDLFLKGSFATPDQFRVGSGADVAVVGSISDGDSTQFGTFDVSVFGGGTLTISGDLNLAKDEEGGGSVPNRSRVRVTGPGSRVQILGNMLDQDNQSGGNFPPDYRLIVEDQGILQVDGLFGQQTGADAQLTSVLLNNGILDIDDPNGVRGDLRGHGIVVHNSAVSFAGKSINSAEDRVLLTEDVNLGRGIDQVTLFSLGAARIENGATVTMTNAFSSSGFEIGDNSHLIANSIVGGPVELQNGILTVVQTNTQITGYGVVQSSSLAISNPTGVVELTGNLNVAGQTPTKIFSSGIARLGPQTTLSSGTLIASNGVALDSGDLLQGNGTVTASFTGSANSSLHAQNGDLTIGDGTKFNGFQTDGTILVDSGSVLTIQNASRSRLGGHTMINGRLNANTGISVSSGGTLTGAGLLTTSVTGDIGSTIVATGDLTLGDSQSFDGYASAGSLVVGDHSVTINDANTAIMGVLTTIGTGSNSGTLNVDNGAVIGFGNNLVGHGTIESQDDLSMAIINNGLIMGDSTTNQITATGYVKGVGEFINFNPTGTFSPGLSPGAVSVENLTLDEQSTLLMEIGGPMAGSQHDILSVTGFALLDGTLEVHLLNGFDPGPGDSFTLLEGGSLIGDFSLMDLPELDAGLRWSVDRGSDSYRLGITSVPEPGTTVFVAGILLVLVSRRRSRLPAHSIRK